VLALKAQPVRAQVGVIGEKSQRDGRRQTRVVRGLPPPLPPSLLLPLPHVPTVHSLC